MALRPAGIRLPQGPHPRIIFFFIATTTTTITINNIVMVVTGMIAMLTIVTIATAQCCR